MNTRRLFLASPLLGLIGCSEAPKQEKKAEEKPPEPVTGRYAFFQMYGAARRWAPDMQCLRLRNIRLQEVKDSGGKCAAWEATFVSPAKQKARIFTYSVIEAPGNLHEGVFAGLEEAWGGPRPHSRPWVVQALKVDSDEAYQTALKKSEAYVKKNPDQAVIFLLENTNRHPNLAWRVIWGESVAMSGYSIFVDASTGAYLETMR